MALIGKLEPRGKAGIYRYRAWLPVRERGQIVYKRVQKSTRTDNYPEAKRIAAETDAEYFEAARLNQAADGSDTTFADAVVLYLQNNPNRQEARFLAPIVERLGDITLDQITQVEVQHLAEDLYGHCEASTKARLVYDPITAVRNNAVRAGLCLPRRYHKPKGWNKHKRVMSPPDDWYARLLPHLRPALRALVLLNATHGLRISEALERTPADLDTTCWPWLLRLGERDKAGDRVQIELAEHVIEAIQAIPNWQDQKWLFGTCGKDNVNRDIKKACQKAGLDYYGSHAWGRHKAARNFLRAGGSLKGLQDAFRWKSPRMPMQHYGHEEPSEITQRVHEVGRAFVAKLDLDENNSGTCDGHAAPGEQRGNAETPCSAPGTPPEKAQETQPLPCRR
jgi:integrase